MEESITIDTTTQCGLVKQNHRCKLVEAEYPIIGLISIMPFVFNKII